MAEKADIKAEMHEMHMTISGTAVAIYAAVLSTLTAGIQIINYVRDRVRIRISVRPDMALFGDPSQTLFTMVDVANSGRRPVTITGIYVTCLHPHRCWYFTDVAPKVPYELTEGKYLQVKFDQKDFDFSQVEYWCAVDSVGRKHKLRTGWFYKRWWSGVQRTWARCRRRLALKTT
ncbi:MAG TPA: hypothetical protein VI636_21300 [Candidatus Angelobacter sp.]